MARGINKVILVGNLGVDPEIRYMPSGSAVANLRIATSDGWKDKQTGEQVEHTEWHRVVFFNRLAEICGEYLRKGSKVYVEGNLRTRKWQGNDGVDRYTTEIVGRDMQMLDGRGNGSAPNSSFDQSTNSMEPQTNNDSNFAPAPASAPLSASQPTSQPAQTEAPDVEEFNDDIPF